MPPVTIVMYHYVRDLERSRYPRIRGLRSSDFRNQVAYMQRFYNFITLEDCLAALETGILPRNPAILSFDDGFIDHYDTVFPILHQQGIEGWFFPPAAPIVRGEVLDVHKIHFILASTDERELFHSVVQELEAYRQVIGLPAHAPLFQELSQGSRFDSPEVTFVKRLLQHYLPQPYRSQFVKNLFSRFVSTDEAGFAAELYMSVEQLRCMAACGMYIGPHGFRHIWLNQSERAVQAEEIDESLKLLKEIGAPVTGWVFSYPYGAYTHETIELAQERGCALGLTTEVGIAELSPKNAFQLARLDTNDLPKDELSAPGTWTLRAEAATNR